MKKRQGLLWAAIGCCVMMVGCTTVTELHVNNGGEVLNSGANGQLATTPVQVTRENGFVELTELPEKAKFFGLKVTSIGKETAFGQDFVQVVGGALAGSGAVVVEDGPADFLMQFEPSFTEVAKTGEFIRLDCQVKFFLKDFEGKRLFSSVIRNYPSPGRKLDYASAKAQFRDLVAMDAAKWAANQISRIAEDAISIGLVQFRYPRQWSIDVKANARKVHNLRRSLEAVPGIMSCQLFTDEPSARRCVFRVVYEKEAFRDGLANDIAAKIKL